MAILALLPFNYLNAQPGARTDIQDAAMHLEFISGSEGRRVCSRIRSWQRHDGFLRPGSVRKARIEIIR